MLPVLLLAGGALLATGIALYWKNISNWLKRIWEKLPRRVKDTLQGALSFVKKAVDTVYNIMKYYSYDEDTKQWNETVVTTEVSENDVPEHIRNRVNANVQREIETTDELQEKLEMTL